VIRVVLHSWWSLMWITIGIVMIAVAAESLVENDWSGNLIMFLSMGLSISGAAVSRFVSENCAPRIARSLNRALLPLALVLIVFLFSSPFFGGFR
jgi:hypothetical protein